MTQEHKIRISKRIIEQHFDVTMDVLKLKRRNAHVILPRHLWYWLVRQGGVTWEDMSKELDQDHATAMNGARKIEQRIFSSSAFCRVIEKICLKAESLGWYDPSHRFMRCDVSGGYRFPRNFGIRPENQAPNSFISNEVMSSLNLSRIKYQLIEQ